MLSKPEHKTKQKMMESHCDEYGCTESGNGTAGWFDFDTFLQFTNSLAF
jgi:hypothetical protein